MSFRVLGVGIVTLDIINLVGHYPSEDEELRAEAQQICRGGNSANTLSVLSQFNHNCYWAGTLANDGDSKFILDDFSKNKIDTSLADNLKSGKQPTSYITLNKSNGSRTIVHYRDLPEFSFEHFKTIPLEQFDWVHFEARAIEDTALMVRLIKSQHPNVKISIEIEKSRINLQKLFGLADIYIFSKAYASQNGYNDAKEFLKQQKKHSVNSDLVCSWGKEGAYALLLNNDFLYSKAYPPNMVVDTIGAGDTFNAALIHSRLTKKNWQDSLTFACKIAGKKCGQYGYANLTTDIDMLQHIV